MMALANVGLHALHLAVISFSVLGWIWPATRPWHLALAGLIAGSWFVLGPIIGKPGFCFLTGVQHALWRRMGRAESPNYMQWLTGQVIGQLTGGEPRAARVDAVTQAVFYVTTSLSIGLALA